MLEAVDLTKRYGDVVALDRLNLTVEPGEVFCLLGANGAGKTTTIQLFLNFVPPTAGEARICGRPVAADPVGTKRALAYIPEVVNLYPALTGLENLAYFAELAGVEGLDDDARVALIERAGLTAEQGRRRVAGYSKGMRQKIGIAIALAKNARVLLLDEPLSGLDPKAANEFGQLVTGLAGAGTAVLMATHDLFRAREIGSRIGIMKHGVMVDVLDTTAVEHADVERIYLQHMTD
jgi:ABC-2 type transport system ATP-binding protein